MNVLTITGNLGKDARVNNVGGHAVANFSVAMKSGFGDKAQTIWVDCALWGKQAESRLVDYLTKGQQVSVSGEMGTRDHEGKTYITLRVNQITLCGSRADSGNVQTQAAPAQKPQQSYQQATGGGMDMGDDVPFAQLGGRRNAYAIA